MLTNIYIRMSGCIFHVSFSCDARTWLVQTLSLYQGELERIHGWIQSDPLNNSAWHYRYYLVKNQSTDLNSSAMAEIKYSLYMEINAGTG